MYNGIGLTTPRGSGTNGYIPRNLGFVRQRPKIEYKDPIEEDKNLLRRKPNQEILEHERKRELELRVMMWAEEQHLFDGGLTEEEIEAKLALKRALLVGGEFDSEKLKKSKETHQYLLAQQQQAERFHKVFEIEKTYEPGSAFDEKKQKLARDKKFADRVEREKQRILEKEERERDRRREEKERERERRHEERNARDKERGSKGHADEKDRKDARVSRSDEGKRKEGNRDRERSKEREERHQRGRDRTSKERERGRGAEKENGSGSAKSRPADKEVKQEPVESVTKESTEDRKRKREEHTGEEEQRANIRDGGQEKDNSSSDEDRKDRRRRRRHDTPSSASSSSDSDSSGGDTRKRRK